MIRPIQWLAPPGAALVCAQVSPAGHKAPQSNTAPSVVQANFIRMIDRLTPRQTVGQITRPCQSAGETDPRGFVSIAPAIVLVSRPTCRFRPSPGESTNARPDAGPSPADLATDRTRRSQSWRHRDRVAPDRRRYPPVYLRRRTPPG